MKLWQKIFLYTLVLVMLAVSMTSILLLGNSYKLAMDQKKQSVYNEHEFLITSFKSIVMTERLKQGAVVLEEDKVKEIMADTLEEKANCAIVFLDKELKQIYTNKKENIPVELLEIIRNEQKTYMQVKAEKLYTASQERVEGRNYIFITVNEISQIVQIHEEMLQHIRVISMACAVTIAFILLVVVKLLLLPLQKINGGTRAIAQGDYEKRVPEKGYDELSELAHNMNRMAEAVEKNVKALEDVAENRKQFIDNLAHEMKTPLTSILGFSDLLQIKREITDENRMEYAGIIKEEATRMRTLSGKLMELITVGEANVEWQVEDMEELFREIGNSLRIVAESHGITLVCEAEKGELRVDKELFKSLLYNLVDNALKASGEGKCIRVKGIFEEDELVIIVEDEGVGIPPEEVDKITEAFYMVDKVRSRASGGAGLGLALCSEIAALHRGTMKFESQMGKGTRVILRMRGGA